MQLVPNEDESLDQVAGEWRVFQLKKGHRFSTDDQVVAWRAANAKPDATRLLDLGCGIGSVGLMTMHLLGGDAPLVGLEAQEVSLELLRRSLAFNGLEGRVTVHLGDLRESAEVLGDATFDLITGSPPYAPVGTCLISPHPQKAHCRVELRGSVLDYCQTARRHLAPGGRFAYVMLARDERTERGAVEAGLTVLERTNVVFRQGDAPLIAVMVCARNEDGPFPERITRSLTIRSQEGPWTAEYLDVRQGFLE